MFLLCYSVCGRQIKRWCTDSSSEKMGDKGGEAELSSRSQQLHDLLFTYLVAITQT